VKDAYTGFTLLLEAYSIMMKIKLVGIENPSYKDDFQVAMGEPDLIECIFLIIG